MNAVGFATTYSLVDLLDELPLPQALNLRDNERLLDDQPDIQNVQELQDIAAVIAPAIQMARLPSDLDRLRFKDSSLAPQPNMRHHHAQATPLMSLIVAHHQQFQDIITVPPYQIHSQVRLTPPPAPVRQPFTPPQYSPSRPQPQPQLVAHPHQSQQHYVPAQPQPQIHQTPPPPQSTVHPQQHYVPAQPQPQPLPQPPYQVHPQVPRPTPPPAQAWTQFTPPQYSPSKPQPQPQPQLVAHSHQSSQQQHYVTPPHQMLASPQMTPPTHQTKQNVVQHHHHHHHHHQQQHHPTTQQHHIKQQPINNQHIKPPKPSQTTSAKRKSEKERQRERERKAIKSEMVIDTRNSTLEEVLEKFLQETISEQMGAIVEGGLLCTFSSKQLLHLVAITAKLKRKNRTKNVNLGKLTSLMTTLSSQLQVQTEVLKNNSYRDEADYCDDFEQNGSNEQLRMQNFETCCDCAVTALNIMTSNGMDSRVYLEECVEAIVMFVNTALTIITDTSSGNFCSSPKKSSKHQGDRRSSKRILFTKQCLSKLNAKCSEVLALVNDLLTCRTEATLNDSLLLSTSRAALTAFFLMDTSTSSNELQLNALNVITAIFASYKNHQTVILEELIHSIARLPTTKRNRVHYQIGSNNSESISIFSALIMKLIQSLFTIRKFNKGDDKNTVKGNISSHNEDINDINDYERVLKGQYNSALRASYAFLSSFLRRCCGVDKKDDCDYRVLFETFVDDLMTCLYKPDWSSAQLITHVLIKLLISNINPQPGKKNQQSTNQTLKLASLEHLGTICARMIKEKSTLHKYKEEVKKALNAIDLSSLSFNQRTETRSKRLRNKIKPLKKKETLEDSDTEEEGNADENGTLDEDEDLTLPFEDEQKFWLALLTFCQREKGITKCGRNIFCAIWLKELERRAKNQFELNNPTSQEENSLSDDEESNGPQLNNSIKQYSRNNNDEGQRITNGPSIEDLQAQMVKDFFKLMSIAAKRSTGKSREIANSDFRQESSITPESADEDSTIDEITAGSIIKILDVSLPTTQKLIDAALSHIVAALSTTANTNIRSRAMKSLSHVLNDAPKDCAAKLLARDDLQKAIGASLLDQSTSVRESTVELIGRFILNSQSDALIDKYYDMLTNRIMDSGVSVRKRVIKILREICITYPSYARVPEICSIIIKRINDEGEGIRKLVSETFTTMWFKEERSHEAIVAKVACITHVVATVWSKILAEANKSSGTESHFEWLHQLLSSLLKIKTADETQTNHVSKRKSRSSEAEPNEDGEVVPPEIVNVKQTLAASTQIISVLVSEKLSNGSQESNSRADCLAAMTALWSFAKISPLLLTHHLDLFQSFLNIDPKSSFDLLILEKVIQIIELILPSISNPGVATMNSIESNLAKLIIRGSIRVISVSVSCLSELIHRHTRNEQLANDTFKRFLRIIRSYRSNPDTFEPNQQAYVLRALYTCGLLAKHFNIDDRDVLYTELVHFVEVGITQMNNIRRNQYQMPARRMQDERILLRSLEGLGFMFERTPSLMLRESTTRIYRFFMRRAIDLGYNDSAVASSCVLTNMRNYLQDEVTQEMKSASSIDWSRENLKEMTSSKQEDANSIQSSITQLYLRDMLSCALSSNVEIRKAAIKLIHSVHNGGHINPLSIVPSLIALSSDDDSTIRVRADHVLQEIERKYSNFVNMKSKQGVLESFILNRRRRGFHRLDLEKQQQSQGSISDFQPSDQTSDTQSNDHVNISAKLSNLYSVVATNRQQRRAFINALLRYFDLQTLASAPSMLSNDTNESRFVLSKCSGSDILQFVSDNLMFLPFTLLDEPFFLIHQIGITMSNLVSQAVSQFREILNLSSMEDEEVEDEDIEINDDELSDDSTEAEITDEEEDAENRRQRKLLEKQSRLRQRKLELRQRKLQQRGLEQNLINAIEAQDNNNEIDDLPVSILQVRDLVSSLHRCILLMHCRKVIWDLYGITEQKFEDYTPNESTKVTDKPTHRRSLDEQTFEALIKMPPTTVHFNSDPFLRSMYSDIFGFADDAETSNQLEQCAPNRHKLKLEYKRFSQMMTR